MSEQVPAETVETPVPRKKLSSILRSISQLLLAGLFPGSHSQLLFESVGVLEVLAAVEEKKELEAEPKVEEPEAEPVLALVPDAFEEEKVDVQDGI